ncbi:MAG: hypothetical protein KAT34_09575 [Candidatus Aminicenantes bacterium]|nr:hypothetical protein [Candidatus Aminicenantes bacterium]
MDNRKRTPNINALLQKITEYMEEMPSGENDKVDWEELAERKKTAQRALTLLNETLKKQGSKPKSWPK